MCFYLVYKPVWQYCFFIFQCFLRLVKVLRVCDEHITDAHYCYFIWHLV